MEFSWKKDTLVRQETFFIHLLSCNCASKVGRLMNPKSERAQKIGVLKTGVQQHKNRTFQQ